MNPYGKFVSEYVRLLREGRSLQMGGLAPSLQPRVGPEPGVVLIFSPHPDDECIIGALPLRLLRQSGMKVVNVAVTQGSRPDRQSERLQELRAACQYLGFGLVQTRENGLANVNVKTRDNNPALWGESVQIIADILIAHLPHTILFPHERDWNSTHIGTYWLVMDALTSLGKRMDCFVIETEFWGAMDTPNLMVESTAEDVADMVAGTSFHVGEVRRNPFHLFLPAWMQDNVRRGSELVGGQGKAAPDWTFATLYRLRQWRDGRLEKCSSVGQQLSAATDPTTIFRTVASGM
jgi:N-acetylglucosamine malate deacetylase 1